MELPKFCKTSSQFNKIHKNLKQIRCPHCKISNNLILHGYLYGYSDVNVNRRVVRGRRIFCSNRNNRDGCGKTISVVFAHLIKKFIITTKNLWNYLNNIYNGKNKFQAFRVLRISYSTSTIYRLYKRFYLRQLIILKTLKTKYSKASKIRLLKSITKTILLFKVIYKNSTDPFSIFQLRFQIPIL